MPAKNLIRLGKAYRHLKRYRQIIGVMIKYGFGDILERLRIEAYLRIRPRAFSKPKGKELIKAREAIRVRMALEELGPTFVKLGQVLSLRPDLIPWNFVKEFRKLQDEVSPLAYGEVARLIEEELGDQPKDLFNQFDPKPLASASLSQVHPGVTLEGEEVVIKVQRPQIREIVEVDVEILHDLAKLAAQQLAEFSPYDPVGIVEEFSASIHRELDFVREGRNIERFAHNFQDDPTVYVPSVFWGLTTSKVLTMERIRGIKVTQIKELREAGLDPQRIAINGAQAILKQIFEHGFFHADPHPGNIFVLRENVIAPLDYGMMGRLDQEMRGALGALLAALVNQDVKRTTKILLRMGGTQEGIDRRGFEREVDDLLNRYMGIPLSQLDMKDIFNEIFPLLSKYRLRVPSDFALMGRALVTAEGVGRELDPDFDILPLAKPYLKKLMLKRIGRWLRALQDLWEDLNDLFTHLPGDIEQILTKTKKGELVVKFEHRGLEHLILTLDKSSNRLSFSLIIAALIIGSSLVMQLNRGPQLFGFPIFGILGFLIAGLFGLWLVVAILRSGRM